MEALSDQNVEGPTTHREVFGVSYRTSSQPLSDPILSNSVRIVKSPAEYGNPALSNSVRIVEPTNVIENPILSNSVRIVKPTTGTQHYPYVNNESHDYQTFDRQKVSRLSFEDSVSSQLSSEEGQILNVQVKAQKKSVPALVPGNGILPGVRFNHVAKEPCHRFVTPTSTSFHHNIKPKTQEISKVIQDIAASHNAHLQDKQKTVSHHCHFDREVSEEDIKDVLSDASLTFIEKGTFGSVFTSPRKPSLVVKRTTMPVNPNEVLVPLRLKGCPNILQNYAVDVCGGMFSIVQQHCGASLKMLLMDGDFVKFFRNIPSRHSFIEGMFSGVEVLEKSKACHGDLKMENICATFENGTYVPRLIDFGSCQASSDKPSLEGISPEFLPPKVNHFAVQVLMKRVNPTDQGMLLFHEKSDSWSIAMITICLWLGGLHPLKEVQCYVTFDINERFNAMNRIADLTDEEVDDIMPHDLDPVTKVAIRENLRINPAQRWGASRTVEHFRRARQQQAGSLSPENDVCLKRGKKRPFSPFRPPIDRSRSADDVSELMDLFKSFQPKKPPDDVIVPKFEPADAIQVKSVKPQCLEGERSTDQKPTQVPEQGRRLISTLKFKPGQQAQGQLKVARKEVIYAEDCSPTGASPTQSMGPGLKLPNIPNMMKLEASQPNDLTPFKVKALPQKVVQQEDEANVKVNSSPLMPDFNLLGMDWDMNKEPPAENLSNKGIGKTGRRRGITKSKSLLK